MRRTDQKRELNSTRQKVSGLFLAASALAFLLLATSNLAYGRGADDRTDRAAEDAARAEARAARDTARDAADADRRNIRAAEDRARAEADRSRDEVRAAEDAAKETTRAIEETAKAEADLAEEALKIAEDAAKDAADAAEDAAKEAEDAAEDAARAAENGGEGGSAALRDLAAGENPEFDGRGFPVRRDEIVGLDMAPNVRDEAARLGFRVISETRLPALNATISRLAVPMGMPSDEALRTIRMLDAQGSYDFTHYYGLNAGVFDNIGAAAVKMRPRRRGTMRVGMIDTAVSAHAMLKGVGIESRAFGNTALLVAAAHTEPHDVAAHGTAIASLLANEGSSQIVVANVFRGDSAMPYTSADAVAQGLEWLLARDVGVINISLAGPSNAILDTLIRRTVRSGHAIVAAAGNGGPSAPPAYPAAVPGVVAVTAVDNDLRVYRYANQGDYIAVSAFGVAVPAAAPGGTVTTVSGTSFATPFVAAHIARCAGRKAGSVMTSCIQSMERLARDLGAPGRDPVYGYGFIDD